MEWYKHDSSATQDAKIRKLLMHSEKTTGSGAIGYAVYFHCLELIAGDLSIDNITFTLEHDAEVIADTLRIRGTGEKSGREIVEGIMMYMIEIGLFEYDNDQIFCHKLAKRLDQSMTSNKRMRAMIADIRESRKGYVYILQSEHGYKIGKTKNYRGRLSLFTVKLPFEFELLRLYSSDNYQELETQLHNMFRPKLINGEWYTLSDADMADIDVYVKEAGCTVMTDHDSSCKKRIEEKRIEEKRDTPFRISHEGESLPANETRYHNLVEQWGESVVRSYLTKIILYRDSHGKRYKDYAATVAQWIQRDIDAGKGPRKAHKVANLDELRSLG